MEGGDRWEDAPMAVLAGGDDEMTLSFSTIAMTTPTTTAAATATTVVANPQGLAAAVRLPSSCLPPAAESSGLAPPPALMRLRRTALRNDMAAAVFYGECHRAGIDGGTAERAVRDANGRYRRWWVDAVAAKQSSTHSTTTTGASHKRRRTSASAAATTTTTSVVESKADRRKRPRKETTLDSAEQQQQAQTRGFIERVSRRQKEQGGGYLYPPVPQQPQSTTTSPTQTAPPPPREEDFSHADPPSHEMENERENISVAIDGAQVHIPLPSAANNAASEAEGARARAAKAGLLTTIRENGGDVSSDAAREAMRVLQTYYEGTGADARSKRSVLDGTWLALSRPSYNGCLGRNLHQHYLYTLGRMSFDMFRPTSLVCSLQANFSSIQIVDGPQGIPAYVPRRLQREVQRCRNNMEGSALRTYTIIVALVIEPNQTTTGEKVKEDKAKNKKPSPESLITRPVRGIMKNHGYILPDPKVPNRLSIWFTEGTLAVNDEEADLGEWKRVFSEAPNRGMYERANILAARLLLGANVPDTIDEDGTMSYELRRPIGGHGLAYCDVLYLDEDLRVLRGHSGQIYVCARLADGSSSVTVQSAPVSTEEG